ncbi:MAG: zinc metallopeptidase [Clostridia bacterium]|nr:zinc metallopeptidase [Clostridia bacterium]
MIGTGYYSSYIIYVLPALLISLAAQIAVKSSFSKYSKVYCAMTGAQAARRVLEINGVSGVRIERVSGQLTDHFDPRTNVIRLSESVYDAASISAVGVAAHEAGHAVQYAKGYVPIKLRSAILPVSQIGSQLSMPLLLMGIVFSFELLINLGIIFFCAALLFQLVTLPVEFNASRRAMSAIESGYLLTDERSVKGARSVLRAAAMTYVAAVIVSVMQLLRLLSLAGRRRR